MSSNFKVRIPGLEARRDSICGAAAGEVRSSRSTKLTRVLACDFRWSQVIFERMDRERSRNFGNRCRAKKLEASTSPKTIDSILLGRIPSSSGVNDERIEARRSSSWLLRCTFCIRSRAARSASASRKVLSKDLTWCPAPSSTRSRGEVPGRRQHRFRSSNLLPQELHRSGAQRATSNQWWKKRRNLYEPFHIPAKRASPSFGIVGTMVK